MHTDHLGTPRAISNNSNQVLWRWDGDQFGDALPTGTLTFPIRHAGQYYDAEVGIFYNYFRDYDPERGKTKHCFVRAQDESCARITGRYVESDPIGLDGGLNTYGYVSANPLRFVDPYGLAAGGAAIGGAIGAGIGGVAGGLGGGIGGGAACTLVAPGVGTIGCGGAGAASGASSGAALGGVIGAAIGSTIEDVCKKEDDCEKERIACTQLCFKASRDPDLKNVWGGSFNICIKGCLSKACGGN